MLFIIELATRRVARRRVSMQRGNRVAVRAEWPRRARPPERVS
jgi:hypothetical protein